MTNLNELKPGPELDALVAEHVMKWEKLHSPSGDYVTWKDDTGKRRHTWAAAKAFRGLLCWSPSTRIEHAWEVVEKLGKDERWLNLHHGPDENGMGDPIWLCNFVNPLVTATGEAAAHAICLAARKAVAKKNSDDLKHKRRYPAPKPPR